MWTLLPCRVKHKILSHLSLPSVVTLGLTCLANYALSKYHCRLRVDSVLESFGLDTNPTHAMLHTTGGVLSGTGILMALQAVDYHSDARVLDICVPLSKSLDAHSFLIQESPYIPADSVDECGFDLPESLLGIPPSAHFVDGSGGMYADSYTVVSQLNDANIVVGITHTRYYVNVESETVVNLILTTHEPMVSILMDPVTVCMSFVTFDAVVCLYPLMIRDGVGLENSDRGHTIDDAALDKYRDCGVEILSSAHDWLSNHVCGVHKHCGATERSLADSATLRVSLENVHFVDSLDSRIRWRLAMRCACGLTVDSNTSSAGWVKTGAGNMLGMCVHIRSCFLVRSLILL